MLQHYVFLKYRERTSGAHVQAFSTNGDTGFLFSRYVREHPAAHYLQFKQFLAGREYDPAFATSRRFYPELLRVFRAVAPVVRFLNAPLEARLPAKAPRGPLFGDSRSVLIED